MKASIRSTTLAALCLAAGAACATAGEPPLQPQAPELPALDGLLAQARIETERVLLPGGVLDLDFDLAAGELGGERIVKGAPYCAEAVHETVQWLADGQGGAPNRIVRQQTSRLCRDGEGRTRQEVDRGGRPLVYLRDPVARESWVLDPERKTARRLGAGRFAADPQAIGELRERAREIARSAVESARAGLGASAVAPVPPVPPTAPMPVLIAPPGAAASGAAARTELRIIRHGGPEAADAAGLPPPTVQWRAPAGAPRGAGSVTPLGVREVEGLRASGERTSWTIEAGRVGNEKPIQITREVWTSPDLMVTVSTRDFDPRSGETNYRLKSVRRGEPEAALMRVPADFARAGRPAPRASGAAG